jgi:hypothetical protein
MIGRVLNLHPHVKTFPELHFFEQMCEPQYLAREFSVDEAIALIDRLIGTLEEGFLHYRRGGQYRDQAAEWVRDMSGPLSPSSVYRMFLDRYAQLNDASYACDQTPRNVLYMEEILKLYPDAKVVAMVRDPRSVLLSQKKKWKRKFLGASQIPLFESVRSYLNYHPYTITKLWAASLSAIESNKNNSRVMVIKYEDVVTKPQETISQLCTFLGLSYVEAMLDVPYVGSSIGHDKKNIRKGLSADSIRVSYDDVLTEGERYICEKIATSYMQEYGYKASISIRLPFIQILLYVLLFPLKMSVALLFNLNRMKNVRESLKRRFLAV